ncbi:MAG: TetR/AcrR family transcriptional regulator [Microthrixaceae bacterium]
MSDEPSEVRSRLLAAAVTCVERTSVRGFSMEEVASQAGVSRTTLYRYFPGGRSQLVEQAATWEIARFWGRLATAVEHLPTLEDKLAAGLVLGRRVMGRSQILANLMDPELLELIEAVQPSEPIIHGVLRDYLREQLVLERDAGRIRPDAEIDAAADYLMRMTLSWMASTGGADLDDPERARQIVHRQFLAGVATPV